MTTTYNEVATAKVPLEVHLTWVGNLFSHSTQASNPVPETIYSTSTIATSIAGTVAIEAATSDRTTARKAPVKLRANCSAGNSRVPRHPLHQLHLLVITNPRGSPMKNAFAIAMLCLGMLALAPAASAGDMNADNLKDCFKDPSSTKCSKNFDDVRKALEDITNGKKPTLALPVNPKSLPIGDLAKLLAD